MTDEKPKRRRGNPAWVKGKPAPGAKPFVKGQIANPLGSSRKRRMAVQLAKMLEQIIEQDPQKRTRGVVVLEALIAQAAKGNVRAVEVIMDRIDGKAIERVEVSGPEGAPVSVARSLAKLTDAELEELSRISEKVHGEPR